MGRGEKVVITKNGDAQRAAVRSIAWLGRLSHTERNRYPYRKANSARSEAPLAKSSKPCVVEKLISSAFADGNGCYFPGPAVDLQNEDTATGLVLFSGFQGILRRDSSEHIGVWNTVGVGMVSGPRQRRKREKHQSDDLEHHRGTAHRSNETELSHRWRERAWQTSRTVS